MGILKGKSAFVVGGTSSIGLEIAKALAGEGATVCVSGRKNANQIKDCHQFISEIFTVDFEKSLEENRIPEIPIDMKQKLEQSHILCLCYGPFVQKSFEQTLPQDWNKVALLDYALPGICASAALPFMIRENFGRIIFFGGTRTDQIRSFRTNAAYAGAKTGLDVLVKSISENYGQFGITANAILPGFTRNAPPGADTITEDEIAKKVLELGINSSTGNLLRIDHGWEP